MPESARPLPEPLNARQRQLAGRRMRALLQRLPRVAAAERLSDADIAALVRRLR